MSTAEQHSKSSQSGTNVDMGGPGFGENVSVTFSDTEDHINMSKDTIVTFNVGGVIFQTLESTLRYPKRPVSRLRSLHTLERHWDENNAMYFFDRDPTAFHAVLNYMRTGVLHLPHKICSPQITKELLYWGLPRIDIQPCCWKDYSFGVQSLENLVKLETDRQPAYINQKRTSVVGPTDNSRIGRCNHAIWMFISDPSSSKGAKIFGIVDFLMIVVSIVTVCAATLPALSRVETDNSTNTNVEKLFAHETQTVLGHVLADIELFCVFFFTIQYIASLLTSPSPLAYATSSTGIIDIIAILPDIFNTIILLIQSDEIGSFHRLSKLLRIFRMLRMVRMMKCLPELWVLLYTLQGSIHEMTLMLMVIASCTSFFAFIMTAVEPKHGLSNVPKNTWYAFTTLTTVGYGDVLPVSNLGKVLGALCSFSGVITLTACMPILIREFTETLNISRYIDCKEEEFSRHVQRRGSKETISDFWAEESHQSEGQEESLHSENLTQRSLLFDYLAHQNIVTHGADQEEMQRSMFDLAAKTSMLMGLERMGMSESLSSIYKQRKKSTLVYKGSPFRTSSRLINLNKSDYSVSKKTHEVKYGTEF